MQHNTCTLVLAFAEAGAFFEVANVGLNLAPMGQAEHQKFHNPTQRQQGQMVTAKMKPGRAKFNIKAGVSSICFDGQVT